MNDTSLTQKAWTYIAESLRLLYWAYFKPFTLEHWLRGIHPELKPTSNPFQKRAEFATNPRLRRYAGQVWWLSGIIPLLVTLLVGPLYSIVSSALSFDWFLSELFLVGWWLALGLAGVVAGCIVGCVAGGVMRNVTSSVAIGVVVGIAVGMAGGIAGGVASFGIGRSVRVCVMGSVTYLLGVLRIYFWLPEFLLMGLLTLLTSPTQRAQRLRYLPPYFDEIINLPLPFVDRWLVDAYETDPEAARQMVDYLINSTNQQKVAAQAMVGIATDRLERCERLSDIVAVTDELDWIPSPPPPAVGPALIKFLEISRDVCAATQATTPYRQRELLELPLKSLQNLRHQLAFEQNPGLATTYSRIMEQWLRILETARRTLEERARETSEIPLAYVAGPALDPIRADSRFKGRIDLFREIETFALQPLPPILLLRGGRRTGKSSTLNYLPSRVGSQIKSCPLSSMCRALLMPPPSQDWLKAWRDR